MVHAVAKAKRALGAHQAALVQLATRRSDTLKAATMDQARLCRVNSHRPGAAGLPVKSIWFIILTPEVSLLHTD